MSGIPRLNGVIKAFEQGHTAFVSFCPVGIESVVAMAGSHLDGVAFEMEHPLDFPGLRQALQLMVDRRQIRRTSIASSRAHAYVRIPSNGGEHNQCIAKLAGRSAD